jgi:hypothetical protein
VRTLDLVPPAGCSLSPEALAEQRGRARRLVSHVVRVTGRADELHVTFADDIDRDVLEDLIATERSCCSFLSIDYDERKHLLSIGASDAEGREVVGRFHAFFKEEAGG